MFSPRIVISPPVLGTCGLLPSAASSRPTSLPRPPRCLTPYPHQLRFSPSTRSPSNWTNLTPECDLFNINNMPSPPHPFLPSPLSICNRRREASETSDDRRMPTRRIPITLRMTSISPTDATFPFDPPVSLSHSPSGKHLRRIPLSPSAKKYMEEKENRKRPMPILIPRRGRLSARRMVRTPTPTPDTSFKSLGTEHVRIPDDNCPSGSMPFPRTPQPTSGRTAMPLTTRRIGMRGIAASVPVKVKPEQLAKSQILTVELVLRDPDCDHALNLRGLRSPGWPEL